MALEREELEVRSDGTKETIRPSRLALARVSVLRGEGEQAGEAFIDDYIAQSEPVVDYLTAFSGIAPGDLERGRSRHALVNLKVAYKKMWLLLNLGVIFIGHGLAKDFRIINIHVPRAQVVDTVDLFFIRARQRRLSLRFLAWLLLREQIQKETHDSIEDARTALRLWRKYEEFIDAGIFDTMLNDVYSKGRELGFKAPSGDTNCNNNGGKAGALDDKPSGRDTPESPTGSTGTGSMGAATTTSGSGEGGGLITPMRRQVFPNFIPGRLKAFSSPLR